MITEDYVSFETSKLLKEKGFDEGCRAHYGADGSFSYEKYEVEASGCEMYNAILAPTLQTAMKWLREVHFLFIDIDPLTGYKWSWSIWFMNDSTQKMGESLEIFSTYKEAAEAAIKYCLTNLV